MFSHHTRRLLFVLIGLVALSVLAFQASPAEARTPDRQTETISSPSAPAEPAFGYQERAMARVQDYAMAKDSGYDISEMRRVAGHPIKFVMEAGEVTVVSARSDQIMLVCHTSVGLYTETQMHGRTISFSVTNIEEECPLATVFEVRHEGDLKLFVTGVAQTVDLTAIAR